MSYTDLKAQYAELFDEISRGELARESGRHLPLAALGQLQKKGLGSLTVPAEDGGAGYGQEDSLRLLMDLATADANTAHLVRSQLTFAEHVLGQPDPKIRQRWIQHLLAGEWAGNALSEKTGSRLGQTGTVVWEDEAHSLLIRGEKYYTTGTIFADWTLVSTEVDKPLVSRRVRRARRRGDSEANAVNQSRALAVVRVQQPRVQAKDDWDGFGQRLTGTGTLQLKGAAVEELFDTPTQSGVVYIHEEVSLTALLAGVGRAALRDGVELMRRRRRAFNTGGGLAPREDDQLLGIIGELSAQQAAVEELVRAVGRELDAGDLPAAKLLSQQAHVMVPRLVLDICTRIFDTLGASATSTDVQLDRHWRNARTIASHDPSAFMARMVGDWEVNQTPVIPFQAVGDVGESQAD